MSSPRRDLAAMAERIEQMVLQRTHGRIRNLVVEEVQGRIVLRGEARTHHARQLALQGALELVPGDRCAALITVA